MKLKRILLTVAAIMAVIVVGFAILVAMQPSEYSVSRSATMAAPPSTVFAQVNDFQNWESWSPWAKLDPNAKNSFEGPSSGEGAIFRWDGNDKVGAGKMTIIESRPDELVRMKLEFIRPFEDKCDTGFTFEPVGDQTGEQTKVIWTMSGKNNLMGRVMCLFMDMDKMIGRDFETGLASIKAIVEKPPPGAEAGAPGAGVGASVSEQEPG